MYGVPGTPDVVHRVVERLVVEQLFDGQRIDALAADKIVGAVREAA